MNKIHPWEKIDPLLIEGKVSMTSIAEKYKIPYRQVTNRKYAVQNRLAKEVMKKTRRKRSNN